MEVGTDDDPTEVWATLAATYPTERELARKAGLLRTRQAPNAWLANLPIDPFSGRPRG